MRDGIRPDLIEDLSDGDNIKFDIHYGEQKVTFTATLKSGSILNPAISIDGFTPEEIEEGAIRLRPFGDHLVCEGGVLCSNVLPDRIHPVSDTETHFTYGEDVFSLSWEETSEGIKNTKFVKL